MLDGSHGASVGEVARVPQTDEERNEVRKYKRCFHRVMSGIEKGGSLRFLTLTSSPSSPLDIQRSWRKLYMRMSRRGMISGYIKVTETTRSGLLHLHILFRGSFVAQTWLSAAWMKVHGAEVVDIRKAYGKRGAAGYLAKYMSKAGERYSWSWGWVYRGFAGVWQRAKQIVRILRTRDPGRDVWGSLFRLWRGHLRAGTHPETFLGFLTGCLDRRRMRTVCEVVS